MKATHPLAQLLSKLKTKKAKDTLDLLLVAAAFTSAKATALEHRKAGRTEAARWWAAQARAEWQKINRRLGLSPALK